MLFLWDVAGACLMLDVVICDDRARCALRPFFRVGNNAVIILLLKRTFVSGSIACLNKCGSDNDNEGVGGTTAAVAEGLCPPPRGDPAAHKATLHTLTDSIS